MYTQAGVPGERKEKAGSANDADDGKKKEKEVPEMSR